MYMYMCSRTGRRCEGEGAERGRQGAEGRERLKSFGMPAGYLFAPERSLLATFRCVRSSVMKPRNGLAPRFAIMAQGKNRHLPRSYPNPVMNKGLCRMQKCPVFPSLERARAVIGPVTKTGSQINSIINASRRKTTVKTCTEKFQSAAVPPRRR